jgi:hypothetical protein
MIAATVAINNHELSGEYLEFYFDDGTQHQWQSNGLSLSILILFLQLYPFHNPDRERQ